MPRSPRNSLLSWSQLWCGLHQLWCLLPQTGPAPPSLTRAPQWAAISSKGAFWNFSTTCRRRSRSCSSTATLSTAAQRIGLEPSYRLGGRPRGRVGLVAFAQFCPQVSPPPRVRVQISTRARRWYKGPECRSG